MKIKIHLLLIPLFGIISNVNAQNAWALNGNPNTNLFSILGSTTTGQHLNIYAGNIRRQFINAYNGYTGFGNGFGAPDALVHINTQQNNTGEAFRTTGFNTIENSWRMFTGPGAGTEKFALFNPAESNLITLQSSQGELSFNTFGNNERMRISSNGLIGIGTREPKHKVHINGTCAANSFVLISDGNEKDISVLIAEMQAEITTLKRKLNELENQLSAAK